MLLLKKYIKIWERCHIYCCVTFNFMPPVGLVKVVFLLLFIKAIVANMHNCVPVQFALLYPISSQLSSLCATIMTKG